MHILKVVDTRQYEEGPDDRFHPIPGSGDEHECDRCGKRHEIHWYVCDDADKEFVVGGSCARQALMLDKKEFNRIQRLAARRRKAEVEFEELLIKKLRIEGARAAAEKTPLPSVEIEMLDGGRGQVRTVVGHPSVRVRSFGPWTKDREQCLKDSWIDHLVFQTTGRLVHHLHSIDNRIMEIEEFFLSID